MAEFKVRTKGGATPQDKPRVYFTCHPDDFEKYFDKICEDVFKTHDCAIYYTEDMTETLDDTNITVDLAKMNLYLVPVTFRLMSEDNRAMRVDIAYAKEKNIPILPFMMESGIDEIYYLSDNFGQRQYISPFSSDLTAISYDHKLAKYLNSVLIGDQTANRVRGAFDAYIFLSYRKKDRAYANELMKAIHNIPGCRDIAVWYDEFLAPGESFVENIEKAMEKSELFTLLVTPNLLEDGNFVITDEYPMARRANMDILPTEMVETDYNELSLKFNGIPNPVKSNDECFSQKIISTVKKISVIENDDDPSHNFLIGLAYLNGIDVEVNMEFGLSLITSAAECSLPEAMEKLYYMYRDGNGVSFNYWEALKWIERLVECIKPDSVDNKDYLISIKRELAYTYDKVGYYQEANMVWKELYNLCVDFYGERDINTFEVWCNLAYSKTKMANTVEDFSQALRYISDKMDKGDIKRFPFLCISLSKILDEVCRRVSTEDQDVYEKILKYVSSLQKKCYESLVNNIGESHIQTLEVASKLAYTLSLLGDKSNALDLQEIIFNLQKELLGENHPDTLATRVEIADLYFDIQAYDEACRIYRHVYSQYLDIYGEYHPVTIELLQKEVSLLMNSGKYIEAIELNTNAYNNYQSFITQYGFNKFHVEKIVRKYEEIMDERKKLIISCATLHSSFIGNYERLGENHEMIIKTKQAMPLLIEMLEKSYRDIGLRIDEIVCDKIEQTPFVIAVLYIDLDKWSKAGKYLEVIYKIYDSFVSEQNLGIYIDSFVLVMKNLSLVYTENGDYSKSLSMNEKILDVYRKKQEEHHLDMIDAMEKVAESYCNLNEWEKAYLLYKQIYLLRCKALGRRHKDTVAAKNIFRFIRKNIRKKKI